MKSERGLCFFIGWFSFIVTLTAFIIFAKGSKTNVLSAFSNVIPNNNNYCVHANVYCLYRIAQT